MLNDRDEVADDRLSLRFDDRVESERPEILFRRGDCYQSEVASLVVEEERLRVELEQDWWQGTPVDTVLVVELHGTHPSHIGRGQNMVVREQEAWRDERAGAVSDHSALRVADVDTTDSA